jgi:hypothetical protein
MNDIQTLIAVQGPDVPATVLLYLVNVIACQSIFSGKMSISHYCAKAGTPLFIHLENASVETRHPKIARFILQKIVHPVGIPGTIPITNKECGDPVTCIIIPANTKICRNPQGALPIFKNVPDTVVRYRIGTGPHPVPSEFRVHVL